MAESVTLSSDRTAEEGRNLKSMMEYNTEYFIREIEYSCGKLSIYQATIGDVGHVVWDAALVLSKFLDTPYFKECTHLSDKVVVELGAGTGIVSLVAAMLGATVYATDLEELVLLIQKNIDENKKLQGNINAVPLKWGKLRKDNLPSSPDIILIADCVYYEESLHPLIETMQSFCSPKTKIYLSYEERKSEQKLELLSKFFEHASKIFVIDEIPQDVQDPLYRSDDIHILEMTLKEDVT